MSTPKPRARSRAPARPHGAAWQRARRPEQKEERRQAIFAAALSLLDEVGVEGTTLSEIARRAGLSKTNCYRYFESREAILLELTLDLVDEWTAAIAARLEPLAGSLDVDAVADAFALSTAERPRLCALVSSISSVLERNVSEEVVVDFKRQFNAQVYGSSDAMRAALPDLTSEQAEQFVLLTGLFVGGAWPSANPPPAVARVHERDEFAGRKLDFEATLVAHARVVLRGLLAGEPSASTSQRGNTAKPSASG